ncbi:MAG: ATP-binding protein [Deltaproteobacteria bacterium]|nr:ATP-binding protein [Deltaproteobacteria bacterium]
MKEIVVISGKGGTGKTSFAASFAVLGGSEIIVADCDVDAADMHLLLAPDFANAKPFFAGELAVIDPDLCTACDECARVCRFDAVKITDGIYSVDEISCEGCGYCARVCPVDAITNVEQNVGDVYRSQIRTGTQMLHARLGLGADNSGKLVAQVKSEARKAAEEANKKLILVDGSPGIGCPVVSSLSGASFAVLVTECTLSGLHDLKRVYEVVKKFNIKSGCIINKADLNTSVLEEIRSFLDAEDITNLEEIPYDEAFTAAITQGRTIVENDGPLKMRLESCWSTITKLAEIDVAS